VNAAATPEPAPTPAEVGRARAYITGVANGFGIQLEEWTGIGDGTARVTDRHGTTLLFTGDELHPFDALSPGPRHGRHRIGVTWAAQLVKARADTAACARTPAPTTAADTPASPARPAQKPSPLWLINRAAAQTPDEGQQKPAAS
jgi:hypothetical protein